jgi:AcrR family transcriptional regulator
LNIECRETTGANETRCRILGAARMLFSRFGFFGTSIRDIAKASSVNLSAVNYHFQNKENLLWEVISDSYESAEEAISRLAEEAPNFEGLALGVFDHFVTNKALIRNTMKLLMTDGLQPPADSSFMIRAKQSFGPPGSRFFASRLQNEIDFPLSDFGVHWGVKSVFGAIVHWSSLCTSSHFEALRETNPYLHPDQVREDVRLLARSTLFYIQSHSELFKAPLHELDSTSVVKPT